MTGLTLILILIIPAGGGIFAQQPDTTTVTDTVTVTDTATVTDTVTVAARETPAERDDKPSYETRNMFTKLVQAARPGLGSVLRLEPTLLTNADFMARYPELALFVSAHPDIPRNSSFYLAEFRDPLRRDNPFEEFFEFLAIAGTFLAIAFALAWMVRAIIEQKRWNRLSRTQAEVHNKILDRFSSSQELLDYIKTPAGTKFLESAPIPLRPEPPATASAPAARIVLSIQIGVIIAMAGLGMLLVSFAVPAESAEGLFVMGAIGFCTGLGFIASGFVSIVLSRRLRLWQNPGDAPAGALGDSGFVK